MKSVAVPSTTFNVILMPGQTKEQIIEAFMNISEFGYSNVGEPELDGLIPDVRAKIEVTVTDGKLNTAITLQGIESRFQNLGRAV